MRGGRSTALAAALLSLAGLAAGTAGPAAPASPAARQGFGEQLAVRETELVFGPDDELLRTEPAGAFRVVENGRERPVVRAERLADETWTVVVYVDLALAQPETGFLAALALSRASDALAGRGRVELVVADPEPKTRLAPTREPRVLANAFADLANELRQARDRRAGEPPPDVAMVRRQLDRLVAFVAGRPQPVPHALVLVADGRDFPPAVLNTLDRDRVDPAQLPEEGGARAYATAARALAAYAWEIFPMPLRQLSGPPDSSSSTSSGADRSRPPVLFHGPPSGAVISLSEIRRRLRGMHPRRPPDPLIAEYGADARLAVLRAMARIAGGRLVGSSGALEPALEDLSWRWHLWFSAPATVDGRIHPVTVELIRTGDAIRGPQWLRSGVPEELADARLGALLAGSAPAGDLKVELAVETQGDAATVRVRLAGPPPAEAGPLRVSLATDAGGTLRRDLLQGSEEAVEVKPPPGARRLAAVVEDLAGERWGSAVAELR